MTPRPRPDDPPGVLPAAQARALAALLHLHARQGRATVREVADEVDRSLGPTYYALRRLARRDLVELGPTGGLRPLVRPVPLPRKAHR